MGSEQTFDRWIDALETEVIQGEYGYEPGEFTVYPDHWRKPFSDGLTPSEAFRRALDAYANARIAEDVAKAENWKRIQEADRLAIERERSPR